MDKIARKYFLPILLGSVLIFAIDTATVDASKTSSIDCDFTQVSSTASVVHLEDNEFWDKFRESVMKDKDKSKNPPDYSNDEHHDDTPKHDVNHSTKHQQ